MNIEITQHLDPNRWDAFCLAQGGNVFQSPHFAQICRDTRGCRMVSFFALSGHRVLASVGLTEIRHYPVLPGVVARRLVCYGGPLWENSPAGEDALVLLMQTILRSVSLPSYLYLEIRNFQDTSPIRSELQNLGLQYVPYLNYLVDLTLSSEQLWENLSKEKRRKIRKAERHELFLKETQSLEDLAWFYNLLVRRYREKGVPLVDGSHFQNHFEEFSKAGLMRLFLVEWKRRPVAGVMVLVYNRKAYEWYAVSDPGYHHLRPNDWRVWQVMQRLKADGITCFDFCGAGYPDQPYGVRQFKKTFGGRQVEWGRYLYLPRPSLYRLLMQLYRWRQKMVERGW